MTFLVDDDGLVAAFDDADDALAAAAARQAPERRQALHTGEARLRGDGEYAGPTLRRCERLRDIANPGQTLLSGLTASLLSTSELRDRGLHRLSDLSHPERVFELGAAGPPLRSLDTSPNNLPIQLTSFVGRGDELAAVRSLLTGERLVTLTGAGGSGKTRLAAQAAADQAGRWRDGVWWVELAAIVEPAAIAAAVAAATGVLVEPTQGPLSSLVAQLRDRRLLLCLDNCEHVLDAAAELAEPSCAAAPR